MFHFSVCGWENANKQYTEQQSSGRNVNFSTVSAKAEFDLKWKFFEHLLLSSAALPSSLWNLSHFKKQMLGFAAGMNSRWRQQLFLVSLQVS